MQKLLTILAFYKPFVIWSFLVNIAITIVNPYIVPAVVTKLMLTIFVWYFVNETNAKRKAGYQDIAKKQGIPLSEVEKVGGNTAYEKTLKGNYYRDASGAWRKK